MPGMDGFDVCRSLKADPSTRRIPVLFLTASADVPDKVRGLDLGAADYLTKPFDADELTARVRSVLRAQRELRTGDDRPGADEATGLFNRAYLTQRIEADLAASRRRGEPLACCVAEAARLGRAGGRPRRRRGRRGHAAGGRHAPAPSSGARTSPAGTTTGRWPCWRSRPTGRRRSPWPAGSRRPSASPWPRPASPAPAAAVSVGVALSHQSAGDSLLWHATEALRHARLSDPGTVQFGGELTELHLAGPPVN